MCVCEFIFITECVAKLDIQEIGRETHVVGSSLERPIKIGIKILFRSDLI